MIGVQSVTEKESKAADSQAASHVIRHCYQRGLLLFTSEANGLSFSPRLSDTNARTDKAIEPFADAFATIAGYL